MSPSPYQLCAFIEQQGFSALIIASIKGHHECLSILLAHGAEVDKPNEVGIVMWSCDVTRGFSDTNENHLGNKTLICCRVRDSNP